MKRNLIIGIFALGLIASGCDDDGEDGNPDARADGGDAGDARGDGARADGGDGGPPDILPPDGGDAGRDGGDAAEAAQAVDAVADMGGTGGGGGGSIDTAPPADSAFAVCRMNMTGVTPGDFCTYVMITCGFGSGPGKFTDTTNCMLKYNAYTADQKACAAYHACMAGSSPSMAVLHCPHPVGLANNNPCNLPL
jgi:hypothetical protein